MVTIEMTRQEFARKFEKPVPPLSQEGAMIVSCVYENSVRIMFTHSAEDEQIALLESMYGSTPKS